MHANPICTQPLKGREHKAQGSLLTKTSRRSMPPSRQRGEAWQHPPSTWSQIPR